MCSTDDAGLGPEGLALIEAAFTVDPALREEVDLIAGLLPTDRRARFLRALATASGEGRSPAAVVLAALEHAALGDGRGDSAA